MTWLRYFDEYMMSLKCCSWTFPKPGVVAASWKLQNFSTIGIFTISGLLLQRGEALAALRRPYAVAYGIIAILLLTPMAALGIVHVPLLEPEIVLGLSVFCCVPTTLSTCVTLTMACQGNTALALLLVVATNVLGVFSLPPMLSWMLGTSSVRSAFQPVTLFHGLVTTVLLPLIGGVALQAIIPSIVTWRTQNRKLLSYISTLFLCAVPYMQISKAATSNLEITTQFLGQAIVSASLLHLVFLACNSVIVSVFHSNESDDAKVEMEGIRKALILCTSEKTLPVAVAVLNELTRTTASAGIAVIPCILAHLVQIVIDSEVVRRWNLQSNTKLS